MIPAEIIHSALGRAAAGEAIALDQATLQRATLEGALVLSGGDGAVAVGGNATGATIITGDVNVTVDLGAEVVARLREFLLPARSGRLPPRPQLMFLGRGSAIDEVRRLLADGTVSGSRPLAVRGWPGVGKTTFVSALAYDVGVAELLPDGVLWTSLNQKPSIQNELASWGRAVGLEGLLRTPTVGEAVAELSARLRDARMLLVVDDVWDASDALAFVRVAGPRCRVIVTSRSRDVAEELASGDAAIYRLPGLDEGHALGLLRLLAPDVVTRHHGECVELVQNLEYLPLALQVAGRMLRAESGIGLSARDLIEQLRDGAELIGQKAPVDRSDLEEQTRPTVAALLAQSTNALPDERARECFAFLGAFAPKPATFDLAAMAAVWEVEDARPMARLLAGRGLIEPVGGRFQMHALLVAHARSMLEP